MSFVSSFSGWMAEGERMCTIYLSLGAGRLSEPCFRCSHLQVPPFPSRSATSWSSRSLLPKFYRRTTETVVLSSSSSPPEVDEWIERLPEKKKPMYSHSLPCIEAWLRELGFHQTKEDLSVWIARNTDWHAHLSLDVTDLCIRYLKNGPGNLEKDVERRFSYALSREDIENAILGGP